MLSTKRNYLQHAVVRTSAQRYLYLVLFIAPLLNFMSGTAIDLIAPSLPAITTHFQTSAVVVKNTITVTMLGFGLGALIIGVLLDILGRRKVIITGLFIFILASLYAPFCHSITELMVIRFIQGFTVATASVGSRTLVIDHFSGKQFMVAMLYASLAYSLGPIISPFIGGILQYHFGWRACFYAYAIFAGILITAFILFIHESLPDTHKKPWHQTVRQYATVTSNKVFLGGVSLLGVTIIEQMIYPTVGSFLVQHDLHHSAIVYGNSALIIGLGYLVGNIVNRIGLRHFNTQQLLRTGLSLVVLGVILQFILALSVGLTLWTLVLPITFINFSLGMVFANTSGTSLKLFPNNAGIAAAAQVVLSLVIATIGVFIISHIHIEHLLTLGWIFLVLTLLQIGFYRLLLAKAFVQPG